MSPAWVISPVALLEQPVAERIEQYRLANRWRELAAQLAYWNLEVRQ